MEERTIIHFLEDIFESMSKILNYTKSYNLEKFKNDDKTVDAVIRNLEIIGDIVSNYLPKNLNEIEEILKIEGSNDKNKHTK